MAILGEDTISSSSSYSSSDHLDGGLVQPEERPFVVFYSISSVVSGLSVGGSLIKRASAHLKAAHPHARHFLTLSPMPGFRGWVEGSSPGSALPATEGQSGHWDELSATAQRGLAEQYLHQAAARPHGHAALDPVAHFHLSNGAAIGRVHLHGDDSARGQAASYGCMVNYHYDFGVLAERAAAYASWGARAAIASSTRPPPPCERG
jgi:malonyl-CoA decarboxylase